jgi:AcrR family transcriptional regulator
MRREPRQARSRARVARILAATDAILAADGVDALTVRRIAERAEVPVGSLYQFFPDKGAVIDALARAYIADFDAAIERLVASAERDDEDWSDPVGRMVDAFAALYRSRPGYVALWTGRYLSPELARADEANNQLIAAGVRQILVHRVGVASGPGLDLAAQVAVRTADALLQYAFARSPQGDEAVLDELKRLLRLYLASQTALLHAHAEPVLQFIKCCQPSLFECLVPKLAQHLLRPAAVTCQQARRVCNGPLLALIHLNLRNQAIRGLARGGQPPAAAHKSDGAGERRMRRGRHVDDRHSEVPRQHSCVPETHRVAPR